MASGFEDFDKIRKDKNRKKSKKKGKDKQRKRTGDDEGFSEGRIDSDGEKSSSERHVDSSLANASVEERLLAKAQAYLARTRET